MDAQLDVGLSLYPEIVVAEGSVRRKLSEAAEALEIAPPRLRVTLDSALRPREFRISATGKFGTAATETGLPAGAILVRSSPRFVTAQSKADPPLVDRLRPIEVESWPDPVQPDRTASILHDVSLERVRAKFGELAFTAGEAVAIGAARWFRRAALDSFDQVSAAQVLAQLPAHDIAALLRVHPIDIVTALMMALLRDGVPLGGFASIGPLLADERRVAWVEPGVATAAYPGRLVIAAPRPQDDAERRRVIARAVAVPRAMRRRQGDRPLQVWTLDEIGGWILPDRARSEEVTHFEAQLIEQAAPAASVEGAILLTSPARRADIDKRLHPHYPELMVVASHELPRGIPVQQRGRIRIAAPVR